VEHRVEERKAVLAAAAEDESRFEGVVILGVDGHVWHHVSTKPVEEGGRGPKDLTGLVDRTRDAHGHIRARLLDLLPGRSGATDAGWLTSGATPSVDASKWPRSQFHGYKNAIDDNLDDARAVLDAFHVVKLATRVVDDVRRRVQQDTTGHRDRRDSPTARSNGTPPLAGPAPHADVAGAPGGVSVTRGTRRGRRRRRDRRLAGEDEA